MTNRFAQRPMLSLLLAVALIMSLFVPLASSSAPIAAAQAQLTLTPSQASPGNVISASGRRFPANAAVQLIAAQTGNVLAAFQANRSGNFAVRVTVPDWEPGSYDIVAVAGDITANSSLVVMPAPSSPSQPAPTPSTSDNPTAPTSVPVVTEPPTDVPTNTPTSKATKAPTKTAAKRASSTPTKTATSAPIAAAALTIPAGDIALVPVADARVVESSPNTNYGKSTTLRVDGGTGVHVQTVLKFDLSGVAGTVVGGHLNLLARSETHDGPSIALGSNNWTETTVTWANRPGLTSAPIDDKGAIDAGIWADYDVTSLISQKGVVTFVILGESTDAVDFYSREYASNAPRLILTTSDNVAGATSTPTATTTAGSPTATTTPSATTIATKTPTATKTATGGTIPGDSLSLPIRAAFYYPWFPEAWNQGAFPFTNYHPSAGYYDSSDPTVLSQHIAAMKYGGIQAGIASWWGQGSATDKRINALLAAANGTGFKWTLYYENESTGDPSVAQIQNDLTYIRDNYASNPNFLRINGRFVVFVYADAADACGMADRWKQGNTVNAYLVLKVFSGYATCASQPDQWHQYSPAVAESNQSGHSFSIGPGFWLYGQSVRLTRDLSRWQQNVRDMVASGAPFQLVTTFNEWGEGTAVESAVEWASASGYGAYLDVLHDNGNGALPATATVTATSTTGASSTPTSTAVPPTNTPTSTAVPPTNTPTSTAVPPTSTPTSTAVPPTSTPTAGTGGTVTVLAAGDIASCSSSGDESTAKILDGQPGTVLTLGDDAYESGSASEFANCYDPTWGRAKARTDPAVGNHEYNTAGASGYFGYFGAAAGAPDKGYYSFDLGAWHLIALNSNCSQVGGCAAGSPEELWLRADLAAHQNACTLAYWHHPRFSSGQHGNNASVQPLWQDLYNAGADLVLNGHDHIYERFAPMNGAGAADPVYGVREIIAGTGGRSHYTLGTVQPNSEVRNTDTWGVLRLSLSANGYDWQFLPEAGKTFADSGSGVCHGAPPSGAAQVPSLTSAPDPARQADRPRSWIAA